MTGIIFSRTWYGPGEKWNPDIRKTVDMYVLNQFYITPYNSGEGFYPQFYRRMTEASAFAGRFGIKTTF